jgi:hydrogenase maturation protein HypF
LSLPTAKVDCVRRHIRVSGVVQGVGFRPYIYRLAKEEHLCGNISNDTAGVTIEIEGPQANVDSFLRRLPLEAPPLAHITSMDAQDADCRGDRDFKITQSDARGHVVTQIPADAATCDDCLREVLDPADRRYRYPFTNCTNCGPRFTITRSIPYDRPQTSMASFAMCAACRAEYDDPLNRRFHAQPNACWDCGPRLWITDSQGRKMKAPDAVSETISRLVAGDIVAIKGVGGFHLAVDATNNAAVERLRQRKHRYGKPLAIMLPDLAAAETYCDCSGAASLLLSVQRPIVLMRKKEKLQIAESVAPGIPWLGVFLPYTPLHHLLFVDGRLKALVMTSANLSEEPIAIENAESLGRLGEIADAFLFHDREILQRCDDSVLTIVGARQQILRRARGYVPLPIDLPIDSPPLLAVGGHLKNVFCLASGRNAYQSQHLGDLENLTGLEFFGEALAHLERTFEIAPQAIAHDLHPGYTSTQWAKRQGLSLIGVQHHHAHIASCMAESSIVEPVIGIALDGTGFGTDGNVWGGEVLIASLLGFERFAHLQYVAMPGSAAAIREPWRMAFGHLRAALGEEVMEPRMLELLGASEREAKLLDRMIERKVNSPLTSSCGRLFDAVAALIMGRRVVDYEAQAAIELEGAATGYADCEEDDSYRLTIVAPSTEGSQCWLLAPDTMWRELMRDIQLGVAKPVMSMRFHAGVANGYCQLAIEARKRSGVEQVCLSGGVFHNALLYRLLSAGLREAGFEVFSQSRVSPGDGGLSYGQAAVAAALLARGGSPASSM